MSRISPTTGIAIRRQKPKFSSFTRMVSAKTEIKATFNIHEVISGANAKKAYLYVSTALSVNKGTPASQVVDVTDLSQPVTVTMPVQKYRDAYVNNYRDYAYVRVAVETDKSSEFLWSKVYKVEGVSLE